MACKMIPDLGHHLLKRELQQRQRLVRKLSGNGHAVESRKVSCGSHEIDILFGDGCDGSGINKGEVVGISSGIMEGRIVSIEDIIAQERGSCGKDLSLNLLATLLLSCTETSSTMSGGMTPTKAVIIDSTGLFPIPLLASILRARIITAKESGSFHNLGILESSVEDSVSSRILSCLGMVSICRVFDIQGMWEVFAEVGFVDSAQETSACHGSPGISENQQNVDCEKAGLKSSSLPRTPHERDLLSNESKEGHEGIEILIIDNMKTLISELMTRKEKSEAHDCLTLLSRSIFKFTTQRNILTLIHNTTVSHHTVNPETFNTVSIFASNQFKPAFGQVFSQLLTIHLFLSSLPPTTKNDDLDVDAQKTLNTGRLILEILKDEGWSAETSRGVGWREGYWTAFQVNACGTGFNTILNAPSGSPTTIGIQNV
ncbi:BgTH12-03257 [Blumeria graminis f. sp. triticale]|uniref:BgTH12-03257 n=1 Tax=Blumeria graminis f. sp. triticale TaxID=1689686 RepID=A0A9W4D7Z9_BLUGR|nr:BgTH12-03257 [Blumeria graminis f. sp. triticale]